MTKARSRLRSTARVLGHLLLLGLVAGWWTYLRPEAFGGSTSFVMVSGESMEPTYHTGDLVVVRKQAAYEVGDVVAFKTSSGSDGSLLVIHRVIDVRPDGRLVLQGDNNDFVDPWNPKPADVAGAEFLELRGWGGVYQKLVQSPVVLGAIFGGLVTTLVMLGKPNGDVAAGAAAEVVGPEHEPDPERPRPKRRARRLVVAWLAVGVIASIGSSGPGSASQLDVDGSVIQSFVPALPVGDAPPAQAPPGAADALDDVEARVPGPPLGGETILGEPGEGG